MTDDDRSFLKINIWTLIILWEYVAIHTYWQLKNLWGGSTKLATQNLYLAALKLQGG